MSKKALGKGLGALIPGGKAKGENTPLPLDKIDDQMKEENLVHFIDVGKIKSNPNQPRKKFEDEKIIELAQSIKENGLIQPIIVRRNEDFYEIVAGERRFRAFLNLKEKKIPAIIKKFDDQQSSKVALIENIQRQDLNAIEEALAYKSLIEEYGLKQGELGDTLGKSRSAITNSLRLLELPSEAQRLIRKELISMGHGRALLPLSSSKKIMEAAQEVLKKNLSVRQTEEMVKKILEKEKTETIFKSRNPELERVEEILQGIFSTRVNIKGNEKKGKIEIEYFNLDELNRIVELLEKN